MDSSSLSVIYVNRRFSHDRVARAPSAAVDVTDSSPLPEWEADDLRQDVDLLLQSFFEGMVDIVHDSYSSSSC